MTDQIPRNEYPRPQLVRTQWLNLNGTWQFAEDPGASGHQRGWTYGTTLDHRIVVPFCPESRLSGIGKTDFMPCVWYRRTIAVPESWAGRRVHLHFGAVDHEATVWVNGTPVGTHRGGYTPFSMDITGALRAGDNELVVRAVDHTRSTRQPRGKQCPDYASRGCLYTRTTGIWQTVWIEPVRATFIESVRVLGQPDQARLVLHVRVAGPCDGVELVAVASADGQTVGQARVPARGSATVAVIELSDVRRWEPRDPFLYDLALSLCRGSEVVDEATSYFGLRSVHVDGHRVLLNGRPTFQRLVLDQGFYPDGIYTAPSDQALRGDVQMGLDMGFDGARLHQKLFEPRFLYWADRLGYLCWGEFPNWGLNHRDPMSVQIVLAEWLEALERDYSHPSIVGWCPFNETPVDQNPELIRTVYRATKAVDPMRPCIDTSGYQHVETDLYDVHDYDQDPATFAARHQPLAEGRDPFRNRPDRDAPYAGQPYWVSEYGGIWWDPTGTVSDGWGYGGPAGRPRSPREFLDRYRTLTETLLAHPKMCAFCYTQLYDIEQEVNGLYTYDRRAKFDPKLIAAINRQPAAMEQEAGRRPASPPSVGRPP